tara:strand:- start:247 stop:396 length:150 start_codon:yes stop_codon:yes gene_type:complete
MIEIVKHSLGFCGETWHPNLWTILYSSPILYGLFYYINQALKQNEKNKR